MDNKNATMEIERLTWTEKELLAIEEVSAKINLRDGQTVLNYGYAAQKKAADFADDAVSAAKGRDLGELEELICLIISNFKEFGKENTKKTGVFARIRKDSKKSETVKAKYIEALGYMGKVSAGLERYQLALLKDVEILEHLYEKCMDCQKLLAMYREAGAVKVLRERETTLANLREIAKRTELSQDAQVAEKYETTCLRFERKLRELDGTRSVCTQAAPQIRLLQTYNTEVSDSIHGLILQEIPAWCKLADAFAADKESSQGTVEPEALLNANASLADLLDKFLEQRKKFELNKEIAQQELRGIADELK